MSIPNTHIRAVVSDYLERFPKEADTAAPLVRALAEGHGPESPQGWGVEHVTTGAVVLDPCWRVLMVRDRDRGRWMLPGGPVVETDASLREAARARLAEVAGPVAGQVEEASGDLPLDLGPGPVRDSPASEGSEHRGPTFLYLYRATAAMIPAGSGTFGDLAWRPHTDVPSARLAAKISQALATDRATAGV
ncbi:NUDIX domain-containing protein [Nocardiopsis sp. NPDC055551]